MPKTHVIKIDDILNGYNNFEKLRDIYQLLNKEVFRGEPIQESDDPLALLDNMTKEVHAGYAYKLFAVDKGVILVDAFASSETVLKSRFSKLNLGEDTGVWHMRLTLYNVEDKTKNSIEEIISRFPREPLRIYKPSQPIQQI